MPSHVQCRTAASSSGSEKTDHARVGSRQVLHRVETEHAHVALAADVTPVQPRAGHVRGVENQLQTALATQPHDVVEPAGVAAKTDEDHGARPRT